MRAILLGLSLLLGTPFPGAASELPHPLRLPAGFRAAIFAEGLPGVRMMAWSPRGDLMVSRPGAGEILILPDRNHDGRADEARPFVRGLDRPHGLAWQKGRTWRRAGRSCACGTGRVFARGLRNAVGLR